MDAHVTGGFGQIIVDCFHLVPVGSAVGCQFVQFGAERFGEQVAPVEQSVLPLSVLLPTAHIALRLVILEGGRRKIDTWKQFCKIRPERFFDDGREFVGGGSNHLLPVGSGRFFYLDFFSLRVQLTVSASLSCRQLNTVSCFLHPLVGVCLRYKGGIADQSVIALHFPFVFHSERECGIITFIIIEIIVRAKRRTIFTFLKFAFLYLAYTLSAGIDDLSGKSLQRTEHVTPAEEMCCIQSLMVENSDCQALFFYGLSHGFAENLCACFHDNGIGILENILCTHCLCVQT